MKKEELQKEVRDRIVAELDDGSSTVEVERLQELSRRVLELTDGADGEISQEDVERLSAEFPEIDRTRSEAEGGDPGPSGMGGMRR